MLGGIVALSVARSSKPAPPHRYDAYGNRVLLRMPLRGVK